MNGKPVLIIIADLAVSWIWLIIYDLTMFVLTVAKTFRGLRTRDWYRRNNLMALVIRDGKLHFLDQIHA